jgi:hypothetical protein
VEISSNQEIIDCANATEWETWVESHYQQLSIPADLEAGLAPNEQAKDEADGPLIGSACPK